MGSEAAPASFIEFHITGFKKFHGVAENPTEVLVGTIEEYVRKHHGMPTGTLLGSCTVLETAGEGALGPLMELLDSSLVGIEHPSIKRSGNSQEFKLDVNSLPTFEKKIVWVHFGVNSGATNFAVEWCVVNEATFQCADELGWQTQHAPIITEDGPISHIREVPCLHSLNGIEANVGQFFDFVKNLQFQFFETLQNLRTSVSGTFSESKEPPVTYQMSHSRQD